jgi:nucleoside-diphosphate-sugar epimerase
MIANSEILITGGNGFIGSHFARSLAEPSLGNSITVMDLGAGEGTTGHDFGLDEKDNITIFPGSVTDPADFAKLPRTFDHIIHAAGILGISYVAENQAKTLDVNINGTRNCLEFAAQHKEKPRFLFFSTSEIYGINCAGPAEDEPASIPSFGPRWCYATSKLAGERYLHAYNQQHGISGGIVRPFNVFGPNRYGSNAMTTLVTNAVNDQDLRISGDGLQVRAWCYIDDFCNGALSILERDGEEVEIFNIGDDRNVLTMSALANKIVETAGSNSKVITTGDTTADVFFRIPDIDRAREVLGYEPVTDFDAAIDNVVGWARKVFGQTNGR